MGESRQKQAAARAADKAPQPEGTPVAFSQTERLALYRFLRPDMDAEGQRGAGAAPPAANNDERRRRRRVRRALHITPAHVQVQHVPVGGNRVAMQLVLGRSVGDEDAEDADERFQAEVAHRRRLYRISEDARDYLLGLLDKAALPEDLAEVLVEVEERLQDLKRGEYRAPAVPEAGRDEDYRPIDTALVRFLVTLGELEGLRRRSDGAELGGWIRTSVGLPAAVPVDGSNAEAPASGATAGDDGDADEE